MVYQDHISKHNYDISGRLPEEGAYPRTPELPDGYPRVSNNAAHTYIRDRKAFTSHNQSMYARQRGNLYIVFSYGPHFPMAVYDGADGVNKWFVNGDKYSCTTSKHQGQLRLHGQDRAGTEFLQNLIRCGGVVAAVERRMGGGSPVVDAINDILVGADIAHTCQAYSAPQLQAQP